jgi:hypothetical protein
MIEGTDYPPLAIHCEITRRPDRWGSHVASEDSICRGELVQYARHVLRMNRALS